jgi:ABC-2 type transport system ATP-binding protein
MSLALAVRGVSHRYQDREALSSVEFSVGAGRIFGLLGPNGGGKTTLFRLIATLLPIQTGSIAVCDEDVAATPQAVRRLLGVTFQSASLDGKLTVRENLMHQGHLYGLSGTRLRERIAAVLNHVSLADRQADLVDRLSGGMKRRTELAKCLLHQPRVLLLDEPSTGLDPGARRDVWTVLESLRDEFGTTILVTTHLMDEAERCEDLAILDRGKLVAFGSPAELRQSVGGDCLTLRTKDAAQLAGRLRDRFHLESRQMGEELRIEHPGAAELLGKLATEFRPELTSISLSQPSLEDVFLKRTGHRFWEHDPETAEARHG